MRYPLGTWHFANCYRDGLYRKFADLSTHRVFEHGDFPYLHKLPENNLDKSFIWLYTLL